MSQTNGTVAVALRGVKKGFGKGSARTEVLHGVDLEAYFGEILLIVGPSGSGKTTLMTILAGMLDAEEGTVDVLGESIEAFSDARRTEFRKDRLGFVFQQFNLIPTISVLENVCVPLLIQGVDRKEASRRAQAMLEQMHVAHRMRARPPSLSGGEQQRVAIARALLADPKLLICDEPTASLDGATGMEVMEALRSRARGEGRCVIIVTHDSRVFEYGDRIAHLIDGRIRSIETPNGRTEEN